MKNAGAFAALKIMHTALLAGQLIFIAVLLFLTFSKTVLPQLADLDRTLQVVAVVLSGVSFFAGTNIFKKKLLQIRDNVNNTVKEKFDQYRTACIIQWALLEGPGIFCSICFFLTGNYAFLALAAVLILLLAMLAPVKIKTALQLGISVEDIETL